MIVMQVMFVEACMWVTWRSGSGALFLEVCPAVPKFTLLYSSSLTSFHALTHFTFGAEGLI